MEKPISDPDALKAAEALISWACTTAPIGQFTKSVTLEAQDVTVNELSLGDWEICIRQKTDGPVLTPGVVTTSGYAGSGMAWYHFDGDRLTSVEPI